MITVEKLKQFALDNKADLVGVAPVDRFCEAPEGHRPENILPGAMSVIVCAQRIPRGIMGGPATSYQRIFDVVHFQLDQLAYNIALFLDQFNARAVPVPADDPYRHWEADKLYGRGDLSHKHAAQAAGLGRLGKNSLLITPQFGNRVHLVSIVTDIDLLPDSLLDWEPCPEGCSLCQQACPAGAIGDEQKVDQSFCRPVLMKQLSKGIIIESCFACRNVCPIGLK